MQLLEAILRNLIINCKISNKSLVFQLSSFFLDGLNALKTQFDLIRIYLVFYWKAFF